jgi:hypothetical protein
MHVEILLFVWNSVKDLVVGYLPAILATVAVICGVAANVYCETLQFPQVDGQATLLVGLFSYRVRDPDSEVWLDTWVDSSCRSYSYLDSELGFNYDIDAKVRIATGFALMAALVGGIATVFSFLVPCSGGRYQKASNRLATAFLLASVFQGLSLMIQSSSICTDNPVLQYLESNNQITRESFGEECEGAAGHRLNITSVVFWILAGLAIKYMGAPNFSASEEPQSQTVTYQQNPDGTVSESHVTIVKGAAVEAPVEQEQAIRYGKY